MADGVVTVENLETGHTHTITEVMWGYLSKFPEVYRLVEVKPAQEKASATKATRRSARKSKTAAEKASDSE